MKAMEVPHAAATRAFIKKLRKMSKAQLLATFVESGIATPTGRLTKRYREPKTTSR